MAVIGWLYELSTDTECNICFDKFWGSEYSSSNTDSDAWRTDVLPGHAFVYGGRPRQTAARIPSTRQPSATVLLRLRARPGSASGGQPAVSAASHLVLPCAVGPRVLSVVGEQIEKGPGGTANLFRVIVLRLRCFLYGHCMRSWVVCHPDSVIRDCRSWALEGRGHQPAGVLDRMKGVA